MSILESRLAVKRKEGIWRVLFLTFYFKKRRVCRGEKSKRKVAVVKKRM
jgi:hypothetical protein